MLNLERITGFDWDGGNACKSEHKHGVSRAQAEQVLFNTSLLLLSDARHSQQESRYHALGRSDEGRLLHLSFTLRRADSLIRVISARDMHRKERALYEQAS